MTAERGKRARVTALEHRQVAKATSANGEETFDYKAAMREATLAAELAIQSGDSGALTRALALKVKLAGVESPSSHGAAQFAGLSDEELLEGIKRDLEGIGYTVVRQQ